MDSRRGCTLYRAFVVDPLSWSQVMPMYAEPQSHKLLAHDRSIHDFWVQRWPFIANAPHEMYLRISRLLREVMEKKRKDDYNEKSLTQSRQ